MSKITHHEGFEPAIITQHNYAYIDEIMFLGWTNIDELADDSSVVAIFKIKWK